MKSTTPYPLTYSVLLLIICFVLSTQPGEAGRRPQSANPRGAAGPGTAGPGAAGPGFAGPGTAGKSDVGRAVADPGVPGRGAAGPGAAGPGVAVPRATAAYVHALPAGYETRVYGGLNYYYSEGACYYAYAGDGPTIYVPATVVNGVPAVPPRPYVYSLPAGYTIQSCAGENYYVYYGYYYYAYYINGQPVYVLATVVNGVPTVPPPPY